MVWCKSGGSIPFTDSLKSLTLRMSSFCEQRKDFPQGLKLEDRAVLMSELKLRPKTLVRQAVVSYAKDLGFSLIRRFCAGFGVWMAGRPVFWREGHMPEQGIGQEELHSYLGLVRLTPINVRDNALERRFGLDVRQREPLPSINLGQQVNQRTVSTDGPRLSFFFEGSSAGLSRDTHGDGHQYALAPAAVCREPGGFSGLG